MSDLQSITLGGGCFWCTEAVFDRVRGVTDVQSGYANGDVAEPTYEQVCSGTTGHAEVVRVTFDPAHQDVAEELLRQMGQDKLFGAPVVTEVAPLVNYWPAEDYHQDYYRNHPNQGYCAFVVGPKVEKFRKTFARHLKPGA